MTWGALMHAEVFSGQAEAARFWMHRGDDQNAATGKCRGFVAHEDPVAGLVLLGHPEHAAAARELDRRRMMDRRDRPGQHVHRDRTGAVDDVLVHWVLGVGSVSIKDQGSEGP